MVVSNKTPYRTFLKKLRAEVDGSSVNAVARKYGVNNWHVWQMLNEPDYKPSPRVLQQCNAVWKITPPRLVVYRGTDAAKVLNWLNTNRDEKWSVDNG